MISIKLPYKLITICFIITIVSEWSVISSNSDHDLSESEVEVHRPRSSRRSRSKKKVVIIGEMSDMAFADLTANASNVNINDVYFDDYDDYSPKAKPYHRRPAPSPTYSSSSSSSPYRGFSKRNGYVSPNAMGQAPQGSVFVPVAAYSVTHSRVNPGQGQSNLVRRRGPGI